MRFLGGLEKPVRLTACSGSRFYYKRGNNMNKKYLIGLCIGLGFAATGAIAATEEVDSMLYQVSVEQNETIELANGVSVETGGLFHANIVNADGEHLSQWCRGTFASNGDTFLGGAGYCTIVDSVGDFFWVWFTPTGPTTNAWGVIGGTGQYQGATGGGTTEQVAVLPDGRTTVARSKGTITTR